jgi:hypothetical protein
MSRPFSPSLPAALLIAWASTVTSSAQPPVILELEGYDPACGIDIAEEGPLIRVAWPMGSDHRARLTFEPAPGRPLIRSAAVAGPDGAYRTLAEALDPALLVRTGERDLRLRGGWTIFFDRMQRKPSEVHEARLEPSRASASSLGRRASLTIGELAAGRFRGELRWTFYAGCPFFLQEAVLATEEDATAYLYDSGLVFREGRPQEVAWRDAGGAPRSEPGESFEGPRTLAVRGRAIAAQFAAGSLALFPPPHRYFYPLDFSDNLRNIWVGPGYGGAELPFGFGIRHDPSGDDRFVPWFNAPPGTRQEMGLFISLSPGPVGAALREVARLTRDDRFQPLPGHLVFTSHYHVEHTEEVLKAQAAEAGAAASPALTGKLPSGGEYRIPERLRDPGFARVFREQGVDIVHLAEFHFGRTPRMDLRERLENLEVLHAECRRLSDENFLLLPGEEPNVHLGGHWISLFPKPVYWVLNRPEGTPFVSEQPLLGRIYHTGNAEDVLRLLEAEGGLAWTAHPRIKSSTGFPDQYRERDFFRSERFLGAAWKAMPADLSIPRLGSRVLDLLDDMANWGHRKYVLGEVDVFKIEPDHELFGHMNANYLRLEKLPRFDDGWQPVLDALRGGRFFVTTGEVLIPEFTVEGRRSGEELALPASGKARIRLDLEWTFPVAYAEVVSGDGRKVTRERFDLSRSGAHGKESMTLDVDLSGRRWVRVEVWDVATNGAFTQPVWLNP